MLFRTTVPPTATPLPSEPLKTFVVSFVVFTALTVFLAAAEVLVKPLLFISASVTLSSFTTPTLIPAATPTSEAESAPETPLSSTSLLWLAETVKPLFVPVMSYIPALTLPSTFVREVVPATLTEP